MPSAILLLLFPLYLIPSILTSNWRKFNTRPEDFQTSIVELEITETPSEFARGISYLYRLLLPSLDLYSPQFLYLIGTMSTRYWDEIDWYIQEGTQKLCEMLSKENEDAASSQWSTGEDDHDHRDEEEHVENTNTEPEDKITTKPDDLSMKDGTSDADSEKEDYMERSTSVEDDKMSIIQKQTKVDELITLCHQCNMMPPIYTYFTAGEEQVVSTVQLWNGMRFSSRPQLNRDKAMEEAASEAIGYLKNEQKDKRPVSTSPPSSISYFVPVQNVLQPQYYNAPQAAYVPPVTYASGHSPAYLLPSVAPGHVTYPLLPPAPVMSLPPDYQTTHQGMIPAYRFDPSAYNPYLLRMQVSPSHHNNIGPYYHTVGAQPVLWGGPQVALSEAYQIKDFANLQKKATTEYKLVDEPPLPKTPQESECRAETTESKESDAPPDKLDPSLQSQKSKKSAKLAKEGFSAKKQVSSKPKLAISFVKAPDKK